MSKLILVCGSRKYPRRQDIVDYIKTLDPTDIVISGMASGPDAWAAIAAAGRNLEVIRCPADWARWGKDAGFRRNSEMLDLHPQEVVAFYDGSSTGTLDTMVKAVVRDIPVHLYLHPNNREWPMLVDAIHYHPVREYIAKRILRIGKRRSGGIFPPATYARLRHVVDGRPWVRRPTFGDADSARK